MSMHPNGVILMLAGVVPYRINPNHPDEHTVLFKRDSSWLMHKRNINPNGGVSRAIDVDTWEIQPNASWRIHSPALNTRVQRRFLEALGPPAEWAELEGEAPLFAGIPTPLIRRFTETL